MRKQSGGELDLGGGASERLPPVSGPRRQVKWSAGERGLRAWTSGPLPLRVGGRGLRAGRGARACGEGARERGARSPEVSV